MDTLTLSKILLNIIPNRSSHVCAINQLNFIKDKELFLIVNTDTKAGVHWFALCKTRNQKFVDIFDSFGVNFRNYQKYLLTFLKQNGGKVRFNNLQYQPNYSNSCGAFCLYFLFKRATGKSFRNILSDFSQTNLQANENLVTRSLKTYQVIDKQCMCKTCVNLNKNKVNQCSRKCSRVKSKIVYS